MHLFDRDMSLDTRGESEFSGTLSDEWSINGNPNGGYLMAVMASAMMKKSEKKTTCHYHGKFSFTFRTQRIPTGCGKDFTKQELQSITSKIDSEWK